MTLREVISLYNFRYIMGDQPGMYHENTLTIRIYYGDGGIGDWFEFGVYDFSYEDDRDARVEKIINKKLLDKEVSSIRSADEIGCLEIHLDNG